jgi:hypothetical protein
MMKVWDFYLILYVKRGGRQIYMDLTILTTSTSPVSIEGIQCNGRGVQNKIRGLIYLFDWRHFSGQH